MKDLYLYITGSTLVIVIFIAVVVVLIHRGRAGDIEGLRNQQSVHNMKAESYLRWIKAELSRLTERFGFLKVKAPPGEDDP